MDRPRRGRMGTKSRSASPYTVRFSTCGQPGIPKFFSHRLRTSMTRATVEDSTAGLGQTLRTGPPLVGGLSFHHVSRMCMNPTAHSFPRGIQAYETTRPMHAGSLALGVGQLLVTRPCGKHRRPDLKHINTQNNDFFSK